MTRANPEALRPGINFSNPSADIGSLGAPNLAPYISDNLDFGVEWYTGREGYVAATVFQKTLNGFTVSQNNTLPFSALAQYGVTYESVTPTMQQALDARGGPANASVVMTSQRNAGGELKIKGLELGWVQPLDKLLGAYVPAEEPGILITTKRPLSIQRFTAAHELGAIAVKARNALFSVLDKQMLFANHPDPAEKLGFGVMNGTPVPDHLLGRHILPDDTVEVVLCSDGIPLPVGSADGARALLAECRESDPFMIGLNRYGVSSSKGYIQPDGSRAAYYDDVSYLRVAV
jgi:hypothetical protein